MKLRSQTVAMIMLVASLSTAQVPTNGLVAYFPFLGSASDASGNSNNGQINGSPKFGLDRFGNASSAILFDGPGQYIEVPSSETFPATAITIAYWINRFGQPAGLDELYVGKFDSYQSFLRYAAIGSGVWLGTPHNWSNVYTPTFVTSDSLWIFYVFTFDNQSKRARVYINGVLMVDNTILDPLAILRPSSSPMYIGGGPGVTQAHGKIDDIHIYNRVLTVAEVQSLYHENGWVGEPSGLTAYYPFNGNADEVTGNGKNGIVYGATPTADRFGSPNKAYMFADATTHIDIPNSNFPIGGSPRTVSLWVRAASTQQASCVIDYGEPVDLHRFGILIHDGKDYFACEGFDIAGTQFVVNSKWHNIAVAYDGTTVRIYVDGTLSAESSRLLMTVGTEVRIGNPLTNSVDPSFEGAMDDIRVYDRALSWSEVLVLLHEGGWPLQTSEFIDKKQGVIDLFNFAAMYTAPERNAQVFLDAIKTKIQNGSATNDDFESVQRLYLAEHIALTALVQTDTISGIATRGLAGTFDLLAYILGRMGGVINTLKKWSWGEYVARPLLKAQKWLSTSLNKFTGHFISAAMGTFTSLPARGLAWNVLRSDAAKGILEDKLVETTKEFASGLIDPIESLVYKTTKSILFMRSYEAVTTATVQDGVSLATQRPRAFTEYGFAAASSQVEQKEIELTNTTNYAISYGGSILDVADLGSKWVMWTTTIASLVLLGAAALTWIGLPVAIAGFAAGIAAFTSGISTAVAGAEVADAALMVGVNLFVTPAYVREGAMLSFDQTPGLVVEHNSIPILTACPTILPYSLVPRDQYQKVTQGGLAQVERSHQDVAGVLDVIAGAAFAKKLSNAYVLMDSLDRTEMSYTSAVAAICDPIVSIQAIADSAIPGYLTNVIGPLVTGTISHNNRLALLYCLLAQCASDSTDPAAFDGIVAAVDTLRAAMSSQDSLVSVAVKTLSDANFALPPFVVIGRIDYPSSIGQRALATITVGIKNASRVMVGNVGVQFNLLNTAAVIIGSSTVKVGTMLPAAEASASWQISATGTDSVIVGTLKITPDSIGWSYETTPPVTIVIISEALATSVGKEVSLPKIWALFQNYPNPFNPSTTIRYSLPNRSHVILTVFNTLGQQVAQLVNGDMEAGYHEVKFDASGLSSGVYFYRLRAGDFVESKRLLLLR